tara:strand:- start:6567 stop:6824 length:258 start_codon:yes stop_codon:yes gene_type:complete
MARNYSPAERALQLICAKAGLPYREFLKLWEQSQSLPRRGTPESSYLMVEKSYVTRTEGQPVAEQRTYQEMYAHIVSPKKGFGKG